MAYYIKKLHLLKENDKVFWEIFQNLCKMNSTTPNYVCAKIGKSTATSTHWKNGSVPNGDVLIKIADYFNVSVDYLLGRTDNKAVNSLGADFFRSFISDKGLNAIKPILKEKIEAYGYENLERDTGLSLLDIKLFLTTDIQAGTKCLSMLDVLLCALDTNIYDLISKGIAADRENHNFVPTEIAAFGGEETKAEQPPIIPEITTPQK